MISFLKTVWSYRSTEHKERAQQHWQQADLLSKRFFIVEGLSKQDLPQKRMLADPVAAIDFSRQLKAGTSRITVFDQDGFCEPWACGVVKRFAGKSMHQVNLIESYKFDLMPTQESYESDGLITFYRNDQL